MASRGFASLAVRELAREAGIVPTAFYRHFDSVDELATELAAGAADTLGTLVDELVGTATATATGDPAADWPRLASAAAAEHPQIWSVLARGLVDSGHTEHRVLAAAVETARRRLGITLGRSDTLSGVDGDAVDVAADLVVVVLLRHLMGVAGGHDARTAEGESTVRLRVILTGAAAL